MVGSGKVRCVPSVNVTRTADGSREGRTQIVTSSAEHMVRFWDASGRISRKIQATPSPFHVEFSNDGEKVLIVEGSIVRIVRAGEKGDPIILTGHKGRLRYAEFSPDGQRVVVASADGTARIYAIDWPSLREALIRRSPRIVGDSRP